MEKPDKSQNENVPQHQDTPLEKKLTEIIEASETDENLDILAKKLSEEWSKPAEESSKPDLSFSKFQEKLKNTGH